MSASRFINIDGLRAIAALSVLFEHMLGDLLRRASPGSGDVYLHAGRIVEDFSFGRFGVVLFFLISGFVVPFSLKGDSALGRFAITRVCRLYPAMWVALLMLGMLSWHTDEWPGLAVMLANMTMAPTLFGKPWMSEIYWTLFIELIFYFMIALIYKLGILRNVLALSAISVGLIASTVAPSVMTSFAGVKVPLLYAGFHLSFLFSGLLIRLSLVEGTRGAGGAALAICALQVASIVVIADLSIERADRFIIGGLHPILLAYVAAFLVFGASVITDRPRTRWLARIGKISYSIYLFHWIVNVQVYGVRPLTGTWTDLLTMAICLALVLALALAVYTLVERPMIALGHRLSGRLARPRRAQASRDGEEFSNSPS